MKRKLPVFLGFLLLTTFVELLGGYATSIGVKSWYPFIEKPFFTPPAWVFGPVWTLLYLQLAIVGSLLYEKERQVGSRVFLLYFCGLLFNLLWSFLFFALKNPELACFDLLLLWGITLLSFRPFYRVSKTACWLYVPYFLWVSFALVLNIAIVVLNFSKK